MDAFEKYYHNDVVMQEKNHPPTIGIDSNKEWEMQVMEMVEAFYGTEILETALGVNVTLTKWEMDVNYRGATRTKMRQVTVQKWEDGQIIYERFYYPSN